MADERLTDRTTLSELSDGDLIHVVDISDTTDNPLGTSKKGLWSLFKSTLITYFNTQYLRSVTGDSVDNTDPLNPVVNAIPLSGTEVGSPVTGDVQFQNDTKLILNDVGGDIGFIQGKADGIIEIGSDAYPVLISGVAGLNVTKVIQTDSGIQGSGTGNELRITANDTGRGLVGEAYYGANYDNNTYVQKKYVDDKYNVSGTTNYISKFTGSNSIGNSQIYDNGTNVGIGTTSPDHKLHVVSSEQCPSLFESTAAGGGIALMDSTTTNDAQVGLGAFGNDLCFRSGGSAAGNMRLLANGNFGIGTTSPSYKLDVSGTGRFTGALTVSGTGNSSFAGNVGIGTTAPNRDLVVSDATNAHLKILSYTSAAEAQLTFATINSDTLFEKSAIIASGSGSWGRHNMHFCVNNKASSANVTLSDSRMMIDYATGNVGIGTTSPTAKLHVVGLPTYADNATALAGGLTVGAFYHTAGLLKVVI